MCREGCLIILQGGTEVVLDDDLKQLSYYSIESGETVEIHKEET